MSDSNVILEIQCPSSVYRALRAEGFNKVSLQKEAQIRIAISLFADGRLSLGRASEFAGMSIVNFMDVLRQSNVPIVEYDEEEFAQDLHTIEELINTRANDERA